MGFAGRRGDRRGFGLPAAAGGAALSADAVFTLRDVVKTYGAGGTAFRLSIRRLEIGQGEKLAFTGESGVGKSTLLEMLAMILRPTSCGSFVFRPPEGGAWDIGDIWRTNGSDRMSGLRSRHIGYVLQHGGLLPYLSVRENIELPRRLLEMPIDSTADRLAAQLKIAPQLGKLPAELSVGQRQRAAIARALAHEPPVVIADEPTASVDPLNAERIMRMLAELTAELGVTLILSTHAHELISRIGIGAIPLDVEAADERTMRVRVTHG